MNPIQLYDIRPDNVEQETLFCIKDLLSPGFKAKQAWFEKRYAEGLRMKVLKNEAGKLLAFIEYTPADYAWRPVKASGFMFIHCMYVYSNKDKGLGLGSQLVQACVDDAKAKGLSGVCVMTSKGTWMADRRLFEKNGFTQLESSDRFELMSLKWDKGATVPCLLNWNSELENYKGWHLLYADQCPWHLKAVDVIRHTAKANGINLKLRRFETRQDIEKAPSGFGTFALIRDGKLLSDHYISETRFKNIMKKELE